MSTYSSTLLCLLVLTSTVYAQSSDTTNSPESGSTISSDTTAATSTSTVGPTPTNEVVTTTSSPTTSTPTETSLQTNSSNDSETTSPGNFPSTPSSSDAATSTETPSTTLLPNVSDTSQHQTGNNTTEQTSSGTTTGAQSSGNVSTASANPTTSVAPTTSTSATTTPTPTSEGKNPDALVILRMKENSTFSCGNCSYSSIWRDVFISFADIDGFNSVREGKITRRRRSTSVGSFTVEVLFVRETIMSDELIYNKTMEGFMKLSNIGKVTIHLDEARAAAMNFTNNIRNLCSAVNPCKEGYVCTDTDNSCSSICKRDTCNNHGTCSFVISENTPQAHCTCDSNDDYEYSGDKCENEEISKAKVIQIVSGVLGAFCALFLLIIIIMCCRRGSSKSSHLYQIGSPGYANDGYSNESELKRM